MSQIWNLAFCCPIRPSVFKALLIGQKQDRAGFKLASFANSFMLPGCAGYHAQAQKNPARVIWPA
jgi:hypothetical protein